MEKEMINIFYATDENYCAHTGVSIVSLLENNRQEKRITIYILLHQVSEDSKKKLSLLEKKYENVKLIFISSVKLMQRIEKEKISLPEYRGNITADFILFIEWILPEKVGKVLCLDSDTLVLGSLNNLYRTDMTNYILAAVLDWGFVLQLKHPNSSKILDKTYASLKKRIYFNSGVVLFNLHKLRDMNLTTQFIQLLNQYRKDDFLPDQDILNYLVSDRYVKKLPLRYNYWRELPMWSLYRNVRQMEGYTWEKFCKESKHIVVLHLITNSFNGKPWDAEGRGKGKIEYLKYRKLTPWGKCKLKRRFKKREKWKIIKEKTIYIWLWIIPLFIRERFSKTFSILLRIQKKYKEKENEEL